MDDHGRTAARAAGNPAWVDLPDLAVEVTLSVREPTLTLADLHRLDVGHLLDLELPAGAFPVALRVGGQTFASGRLVSVDGRLALQVLDCAGDD